MPGSAANLKKDKDNNLLHIARGMKTADISGSPKLSPFTVGASIEEFVFPTDCVEMIIVNTDEDLRVSQDSTMTSYIVVPALTGWVNQASDRGNIYMQRDGASSCVVSFMYSAL